MRKIFCPPVSYHAQNKAHPHTIGHSRKQKTAVPKPIRFRLLYVLGISIQANWWVMMMRLRPEGKYTHLGLALIVTASFERLGGLWVKTAQILAMRRHIFPKEFCDEIARLHDRAQGFPGEVARQIIKEELGQPIDEVFEEFQTEPIAAASIGQVHVGRLRDNGKKSRSKCRGQRLQMPSTKTLASSMATSGFSEFSESCPMLVGTRCIRLCDKPWSTNSTIVSKLPRCGVCAVRSKPSRSPVPKRIENIAQDVCSRWSGWTAS